jgi:transposase
VVVLDNLKVHHAKILEQVYDSNFKEMLLPPYSCELNPIERLWSVLKRKWVKNLYAFTEEINQQQHLKPVDVTMLTVSRLRDMLGKDLKFKST